MSRRTRGLVATMLLLSACRGGAQKNTSSPSPIPSPSPTTSPASAGAAKAKFCAELPRLLEATEATVKLGENPTSQGVTDAVTLLTSEAGRLEVIAEAYREEGDALKASDIDALAGGLQQTADGFDAILRGESPGSLPNVGILTEQALEGVDC